MLKTLHPSKVKGNTGTTLLPLSVSKACKVPILTRTKNYLYATVHEQVFMFKCFVTVAVCRNQKKKTDTFQVKKSGLFPRDVPYQLCVCEITHAILGKIYTLKDPCYKICNQTARQVKTTDNECKHFCIYIADIPLCYTRVETLIVVSIYLQLIQNRYMFRSFTVLHCSHQHCVQPVASDVEVVGYL